MPFEPGVSNIGAGPPNDEELRRIRHLASFPEKDPNPVIELDLSGTLTFSNAAADRLANDAGAKDAAALLAADLPAIMAELESAGGKAVGRELLVKGQTYKAGYHLVADPPRVRAYLRDITRQKRAEDELRASGKDLDLHNRIAEVFLTVPDNDMYTEVLNIVLAAFDSRLGVFGYIDEKGALVVPSLTRQVYDRCQVADKTFTFPHETWGDSAWPRAIREKRAVWSNEPSAMAPAGHVPVRRHISMPIVHKGEAIGLFQVANRGTDYAEEDVLALRSIADYVAPLLHARLERDLWERERRQAEEAFASSEQFLRNIIEQSPVSLWISDSEGTLIKMNRACRELFGAKDEDVVGKYNILKDNVIEDQGFMPLVENVFEKGEIARFIIDYDLPKVRHIEVKGGTHRILNVVVSPIKDIHGKLTNALVQHEDITDRKRAQEKIYLNSMILHQLISSVSTADINGVIDYVNPAFLKLWGYESVEQAIGQSFGSFFARPEDADTVLEAIAKNGFWEGRFLANRKDGIRFFCHGYASKLLDSKGKHIGYESTNLDVTDIVKAEEHIRLNAERTETLVRINQMTGSTLQQITDFALEEAVRLTGSTIGYLAFLNEDESVLTMHSWSKSAMAECAIVDKPIIYPVDTTGLWGDAVRQRRAVITNDYSAPVAGKKGYPKGHVTVSRHMNIPVFSGKRIVLVAGVGNKTEPYDERDVKQLTLLMEGMHNLLDRKRAEWTILESEERFRTLVETMNDGLAIQDTAGILTYTNPSLCQMLGYAKEEIIGRPWKSLIDPEALKVLADQMAKWNAGQKGTYEIPWRTKDGRTLNTLISGAPIHDQAGNLKGSFGVITDISERKRAQDALRLKNLVFDASIAANSISDRNGVTTEANDAFLRVWGFQNKDEAVGKPILHFLNDPNEAVGIITALNNTGEWKGDYTAKRKDGSTFIAYGLATTVKDESGEIIGYQSAVMDVTEQRDAERELERYRDHLEQLVAERTADLKKSEEKFRTLADFTYDWEYWIDPNRRMVYISPSCERITGFPPAEFHNNPKFMDTIIHPDDRRVFAKHIELFFLGAKHNESCEIEFRIIDKKGDIKWIAHSCTTIMGDGGEYLGRRGSNRDITERKMAENVIQQRTIELEAMNRELESFSYSVSHDLRAPLRTIDGFSLALLEDYSGKVDETGMDHLRRVRAATLRMAQLIDDLLKLSRVSRGELKIERADLGALARSVENELKKSEPKRKVDLVLGTDLVADGDARLLHLVMENLLSNAWKFTGKHPKATVTIGKLEKAGEIVFFVRDDGAGFDMAYVGKLFGPFQRLHSTEEFPGSGIGLATVQRIVHRHGGRIWAEGAVEKGATFWFTLNPKDKVLTKKETDVTARKTDVTARETDVTARETDATRRETGAAKNEKEAALRKKDLSKKKKDAGDGK